MSEKKVADLTLLDITERMLHFALRNDIADVAGYASYNDGVGDALTEMRRDMQVMTESEFVAKYEQVSLEKGDEIFELDEDDPQAQHIQGYCSTIEDILNFINPAKMYEETEMLREGIALEEEIDEDFFDEIFGEEW